MIHAVLGLWHGLAAVQNAFDILATTDVAPELRPFASKNAAAIAKLLERLEPSTLQVATLLAGICAIEAAAAVAFARGAFNGKHDDLAFSLSLGLFGAFFLVDDAFDNYELGADHRAIFTLVAASYSACRAARL
jgi:hypothetical protein